MAKFINESGSVLTSWEHGWSVGPNGELDWPDYDAEQHGATPGLRRLDDPPKRARAAAAPASDKGADSGASNPDAAAGETSNPAGLDGTSAADAAGEENPT